ncbi:gamma-glutamyltransferase family protein [Synechococcus sp. RSCCF101]|nr:gamma-glutamyltransferase family protein [Synechococcus sp. RSCCF101]
MAGALLSLLTGLGAAPVWAQPSPEAPEAIEASRPTVSRAEGRSLVVTAHPLASQAALAVLREGGSAMDAVVTAQTVLAVVEPQSSGLGGGGFLLHWDQASGRLQAFDGRETAPAHATPASWLKSDGTPLPWLEATRTLTAIGVPGTVALLAEAHRRFGEQPWGELLQPAIALADGGFRVTPRLQRSIALAERLGTGHSPAFRRLYRPDGEPAAVGSRLRNPELAATLRRLAAGGGDAFYRGEQARSLLAGLRGLARQGARGRGFAAEDLAAYRALERKPLCLPYRRWRVCSVPPPSGGGLALLQSLALLQARLPEPAPEEELKAWHLRAEALRLADADRAHWVRDPAEGPIPLQGLLDPAYLQQRATRIDPERPTPAPAAGTPPGSAGLRFASQSRGAGGGTTHLVVVDAAGNIASFSGSVETVFGSRHLVDGMVLNNQLTDFSFRPERDGLPIANRIDAGKRPMSAMAPLIVFDGNRPVLALGSPGGWLIPHYLVGALQAALDWDLPAAEVVALPHLAVRPETTLLEEAPAHPADGLSELGHRIERRGFSSGLALIRRRGDRWRGAADPRREGSALALP